MVTEQHSELSKSGNDTKTFHLLKCSVGGQNVVSFSIEKQKVINLGTGLEILFGACITSVVRKSWGSWACLASRREN